MKLTAIFKTPDVFDRIIDQIYEKLEEQRKYNPPISDAEFDALVDTVVDHVESEFNKFVKYGEVVTLDFDIDTEGRRETEVEVQRVR